MPLTAGRATRWWRFLSNVVVGEPGLAEAAVWHDLRVVHDCAMAILRRNDTVLMCHRHPNREWVPDVWDFPGGHIDEHESPQQALSRELEEELGIVIAVPPRPADAVFEFESGSTRLAVWIIDYQGPVENCSPDEHDELRWVSLREATKLQLADPAYISLIDSALRP